MLFRNSLLIAAVATLLALVPVVSAQDSGFKVIVNASNPVDSLSQEEASKLLLKKTKKWDDGGNVLPVDQVAGSRTREAASEGLHGRSVEAIKKYWQVQLFAGRDVPPPELGSDSEVVDFVANSAGAIGYVSAGTPLNNRTKAVRITR